MSAQLKLSRVRAGLYIDENRQVRIEFDGDVWVCVVGGSWLTTEYTKTACVVAAKAEVERRQAVQA